MRKISFWACVLVSMIGNAQNIGTATSAAADEITLDVDTAKYWPLKIDREAVEASCATVHPVFFKLFSQGTLYGDAVRQAVSCDDEDYSDPILRTNSAINNSLVRSFVTSPWLFTTTQTAISGQQTIGEVIRAEEVLEKPSAALPVAEEKPVVIDEDVELQLVVEKPNFWKLDGSGSLQFTQNYFSDNWYKGGDNNYSMLALAKLHLLYDNKDNLQWETTLDAKLGFQTVDNDPYRKMRPNNDQLRLTTKFGHKATKNWFYTVQAEATTQFTKLYEPNTENVISDFCSPLKTVVSVGMDYKLNKKYITGSAYLAPVAMTWMYVNRLDLATRYGNEEGKHSRVTWGPNVTVNYTWKPWKNFSWTGRIYYFSNFEYVNLEWENTLSFSFNKYISAQVFLHPRFDDSSIKYRRPSIDDDPDCERRASYFMFKEFVSLGLSYSF